MKAFELFARLRHLNVQLWADGDRLRYKAPKGVLTPDLIAQLKVHKAGILTFLQEAQAAASIEPIPLIPRDREILLSYAQQRLWFLEQLEGAQATYNIPIALRFRGCLDIQALEQSLQEIVRRHEVLRTAFVDHAGKPLQMIAQDGQIRMPVLDLHQMPDTEQREVVGNVMAEEFQRPFDLTTGPLVRAMLLRLALQEETEDPESEHLFLATLHHIISDGWSTGILIKELTAYYEAFSHGVPASLPELPVQYADFAAWQRQHLQGARLERQLTYWQGQLGDAQPLLELPTDRPRPAMQTFRGKVDYFTIDAELTAQLMSLGRQTDTTLFMTLLSAFFIVFFRHSGQDDIVIGSPVANRTHKDIEPLIGCFVNMLVLRADLSGNPTFLEFLDQVRRITLDAYEHQELPFEQLVDRLQVERNLRHAPLFQVMFVLQNTAHIQCDLPGLTVEPVAIPRTVSKFDLTLAIEETDTGLQGEIEYNTDLFDAGTIERLTEHFRILLQGIVTDPQQRIAQLPLLTDAERHRVVVEWNQTRKDYPFQERRLHHWFEVQVEKTPDAVAVIFVDQCLTYRELNRRANQLAHHLQSLGVGPDVMAGVCMERSLEMVISLYGILKAGGAYVPLDPTYPRERIAFMVADAKVSVLLLQQKLLTELPMHNARVVCVDADWEHLSQEPSDNPAVALTGEHLAYVIYTSGSTGKPKGAMNTHKGICNRLLWMQDVYQLTTEDRVLQKTPFSFDVSVWEFFWPLMYGASLVVAQPEGHKESAYLVRLMTAQQITTLHFVPPMLQVFLEDPNVRACTSVRQVICSGEALPYDLQQQFFERLNARLYNLYGPTEAAIDVTSWECRKASDRMCVPIGRPIANIQTYILDPFLQPTPIGVPGELHIGGVGLARGYLNRPELTAEKFILSPFRLTIDNSQLDQGVNNLKGFLEPFRFGTAAMEEDLKGSGKPFRSTDSHDSYTIDPCSLLIDHCHRLYKTGDLARYLPDGNIEFLGRLDHQVKVRGFRIESGEIEAVLTGHPAVRETVVNAREDQPGLKRIVAYLVPEPVGMPSVQDLRDFLSVKLPEYMIPSAFVTLKALPLTPNGKVNRRALPPPGMSTLRETYVAPRTPSEERLASIWSDVLRAPRIGIHDNFFALGGDSILSIRIISRANQAGIHLTLKHLFQHQTVAGLASVAEERRTVSAEQGILTGVVPLTPVQHWFFEQELPEAHHFNQALLFEVDPGVKPEFVECIVRRLLEQHDALRLRFRRDAQGWQQIYGAPDETSPFIHIDLTATPDRDLETLAVELQRSLKLETGPLMRVALCTCEPEKPGRLLIIVHHLAIDGVSWRIMLDDFCTAYRQLSQGEEISLPPKTTSFKQWAERMVEYAQSDILEQEFEYWLAVFRSDSHPLPVDYPEGTNTAASKHICAVALSPDATQALLREVPAAYHTQINDVLLTALGQVVTQWQGGRCVRIDTEGHGREELFEDLDLSRTMGWFTSVFPVLLDLGEHIHPGETLKSVKEQLRRIPRRGIGYGLLRYLSQDLKQVDQLRMRPHADILFNYLGQVDQAVSAHPLSGLAQESAGPTQSPAGMRRYLLEINGFVAEGKLQFEWTYSGNIHKTATIEQAAQQCIDALHTLSAHCRQADTGRYTPSDFPDAELSQIALDQLLTGIARVHPGKNQVEAIYPLTLSQQGMLFESLMTPDSGIHIEQSVWILRSELNLAAFERAWDYIIARHPVLRTAFVWEDRDEPLQVVLRQTPIPLEQQDWQKFSASLQQEKLEQWLSTDRQRGFEMTRAPLLRLAVFRIDPQGYYLIWTHHHILMDGWCVPIILKEISALFEVFSQDREVLLEPVRPYLDYMRWLKQQDISQANEFWRQRFQGFTEPIPLGRVVAAENFSDWEHRYGEYRLTLSDIAALHVFARQQRLALNTLLQGTWALLLSCYSGQQDIVFGATVSGRPADLTGVEKMVGLFMNTLPIRVKVSPEIPLWQWLQDIQSRNLEQQPYEYCSTGQIHQWSDVPGAFPLYESLLVFENYPSDVPTSAKQTIKIQSVRFVGARTKYALTVLVTLDVELEIKFIYDRARFDDPDIVRMASHFSALLENLIASPEQTLKTMFYKIPAHEIPEAIPFQPRTRTEGEENVVPPRDTLEMQLAQIWEEVLGIHAVGMRDNFFDLGGHSLLAWRLMVRIGQKFRRHLPLATLFQGATIEELADILRHKTHAASWSALVAIQPKGVKRPFFCIPGVGGNVVYFYNLARYLGTDQPFYGLQSLGLDGQSEPYTRIEEMAVHYIKAVKAVQAQGPYLLGGHSFGAKVAFEITRQLQQQGETVALLVVLDTPIPLVDGNSPHAHWDDAQWLVEIAKIIGRVFGNDLNILYDDFASRDHAQQLDYLANQLRKINLLPPETEISHIRALVKVFKANIQAHYVPQAISPTRIALFKACEVHPDEAVSAELPDIFQEPAWGWDRFAVGEVEICRVPGDHISMLIEPEVQVLADRLKVSLENAQATIK